MLVSFHTFFLTSVIYDMWCLGNAIRINKIGMQWGEDGEARGPRNWWTFILDQFYPTVQDSPLSWRHMTAACVFSLLTKLQTPEPAIEIRTISAFTNNAPAGAWCISSLTKLGHGIQETFQSLVHCLSISI